MPNAPRNGGANGAKHRCLAPSQRRTRSLRRRESHTSNLAVNWAQSPTSISELARASVECAEQASQPSGASQCWRSARAAIVSALHEAEAPGGCDSMRLSAPLMLESFTVSFRSAVGKSMCTVCHSCCLASSVSCARRTPSSTRATGQAAASAASAPPLRREMFWPINVRDRRESPKIFLRPPACTGGEKLVDAISRSQVQGFTSYRGFIVFS